MSWNEEGRCWKKQREMMSPRRKRFYPELKIDKTFITGLQKDPDYEAIVTVIAMAHSLKLK